MMDITKMTGVSNACNFCECEKAFYTCPRCNAPYCSIKCYQAPKHENCSESFYRDCVTEEINTTERDPEEKKKMLDILKREYEKETEETDSDDSEDDLEVRLEGVDLNDCESVWRCLTESEKLEFKQQLHMGEIHKLVPEWQPWWNKNSTNKLVEEIPEDSSQIAEKFIHYNMPNVQPLSKIMKSKPSASIKYTVVNVVYSYAYMMRVHNGETDAEMVDDLLSCCGALKALNFDSTSQAIETVDYNLTQNSGIAIKTLQRLAKKDLAVLCREDNISIMCAHLHSLLKSSKRKLKKQSRDRLLLASAMKRLEFFLSWLQDYQHELDSIT